MDAVKAFNTEMSSMLDMKPPISRAKMMSITKAGMKAIKLYKHVVQIIEKFIKKCNPELKVPGLYVVDSIIRQSRHQFGEDKDVFGPRFLKNISTTFQSLYECLPHDKDKILRVLSLWQKNSVFTMDVIQPLLDMATAPVASVMENDGALGGSPAEAVCVQPTPEPSALPGPRSPPADQQNDVTIAAVAHLLQSAQGLDLQQILRTLQRGGAAQPSMANAANTVNATSVQQNSSISKVLQARFDYDEEPDVEEPPPVPSTNFSDLQQALQGHLLGHLSNQTERTATQLDDDDGGAPEPHTAKLGQSRRNDHERSSSRRSRSRSPRRRQSPRSRSSQSRHSRSRRSHSRSRERRRSPPRAHTDDSKELERRHKGLPPIKKQMLSVCSTTLWLGQLDKKTQQQDVSSLMEEFGQIESVNMIPPRGCAYIVMVHRQDAYTALTKLSRANAKINHKAFKIAWAMNKGVGGRFKKYWNTELGVAYVPWEKLKDSELVTLRQGAVFDQETLKAEWAATFAELVKPVGDGGDGADGARESRATVLSQGPAAITELVVERVVALPADPVASQSEDSVGAPRSLIKALPPNHHHPPPAAPPFIRQFPVVLRLPPAPAPPPMHRPPMPRPPMFRVRLPMLDPAADFPHPGTLEAAHWNGRPFRDNWHGGGPPRGPPEWFGPEPPFRHGGLSRGGHWGHRQFRN